VKPNSGSEERTLKKPPLTGMGECCLKKDKKMLDLFLVLLPLYDIK